ncbi:diacylglycerol kinase, partial [Staphylococcus arlettae]
YTDMQLNVDGEYGGKLPGNFLNLKQHIEVFTPSDVTISELTEQ